eukprot:CAMPEP_0197064668 /NCGR_PEP_ID=MMETSP1384-20130603/161043_1 /TAXON_ID=29189 /ORGANISM="Ammonia sp." /LENGTH=42 /DNA_ID= /DNA_START= /DNA_END= /DNA_ORIENTATION=
MTWINASELTFTDPPNLLHASRMPSPFKMNNEHLFGVHHGVT